MEKIALKKLDKSILHQLDIDARQSITSLAKKVKARRDTVAYRINKMESQKIIQRYYTVIDYSRLGYELYRIYLKFQNTTIELEQEMAAYLVSQQSVLTVYSTEGDWDLAIGFLCSNKEEFQEIYQRFQRKYVKYILRDDTNLFLEYIHYPKNYLIKSEIGSQKVWSTGKRDRTQLTEKELELLRIIAQQAKLPLLTIAKKLHMTAAGVLYHIKHLEKKKVILGYRALIDYTKLGYNYFKVDLQIDEMKELARLQRFGQAHPHIIYEDRTIGGAHFEFDAELENYDDYYALIEDIKRSFPGIIRSHRHYRARKIYKYKYLPE